MKTFTQYDLHVSHSLVIHHALAISPDWKEESQVSSINISGVPFRLIVGPDIC